MQQIGADSRQISTMSTLRSGTRLLLPTISLLVLVFVLVLVVLPALLEAAAGTAG